MGIENIKIVLKFVIGLGERVDVVTREDSAGGKQITTAEWLGSLNQLLGVPAVIKAIPNVDDEFMDIDDTEKEELKAWVAEEFDIANDKLEETIEIAFNIVIELALIARSFKK